jgi:hypothetical protein
VVRETTSGALIERARTRSWAQMAGGSEQASWLLASVNGLLDDLGDRSGRGGSCTVQSDGVAGPYVLGPAMFADTTVVPIVAFDEEVLEHRAAEGLAPALNRLTLHARLEVAGWEARSAIESVMFVGLWGRTDLTSLTRLGGYGPVVMLISQAQVISPIDLAECDWRGVGAFAPRAHCTSGGAAVDGGWLLEPERTAAHRVTNMRYEQLVDLAAR